MESAKVIFEKPRSMKETRTHYCPGCTHGIIHRLVAETIDEFNIQEKVIGIAPVGCSVLAYNYFNLDMQQAAHGRAPAVATGIKRVLPDNIVFSYQGDGDQLQLVLLKLCMQLHGENITVILLIMQFME